MRRSAIAGFIGLASVAGVTAPAPARAGNDEGVPVGNQAAMTGAVVAAIGDGSALWYNPAGIAQVTTDTADVTASVIAFRYYETPNLIVGPNGEDVGESIVELVSIPTAISYVRPITDELRIGVGLFSPQSNDLLLRTSFEGEANGIEADFNAASSATSSRYVGVVGLGWAPTSRLRAGLGVRVGYNTAFATSQVTALASGLGAEAVSSQSTTSASRVVDFGGSFGVQWDPIDELSFGVAFETQSIALLGSFDVTAGTVFGAVGLGLDDVGGTLTDSSELDAQGTGVWPVRYRIGVAVNLPPVQIAGDVDVAMPMVNPDLGLDRRTLVNGRLGAAFAMTEDLSLGTAVFTDLNPSPEAALRADFIGGSVALNRRTTLTLDEEDLDELVFSSFIGLRYAYGLNAVTSGVRVDADGLVVDPEQAELTIHEALLHLGSSVRF